jgi:hypothetical protein
MSDGSKCRCSDSGFLNRSPPFGLEFHCFRDFRVTFRQKKLRFNSTNFEIKMVNKKYVCFFNEFILRELLGFWDLLPDPDTPQDIRNCTEY